MAIPYSTSFLQSTGSAQNLTVFDPGWSNIQGLNTWNVPSGAGYVTAPGSATDCLMMFDGGEAWADDQIVGIQIGAATGHYRGPATRCSAGNSYHIDYDRLDTTVYFTRWLAGTSTNPTTWTLGAPLSIDDWLWLRSVGTTHEAFYSLAASPTTLVSLGAAYTDAAIASGKPGMFAYTISNDADTFRAWSADNYSAGGAAASLTPFNRGARRAVLLRF